MENEIIVVLISIIGTAIFTWACSQFTIGRKIDLAISQMQLSIEKTTNDTHRAQDEVVQIREEVSLVSEDTTKRMEIMGKLVSDVLSVAHELIELVKIQNALLVDKTYNK